MQKLKIVEVGAIVTGTSESGVAYEYFPVKFSAGFGLKSITRNLFKDSKQGWNRGTHAQAIEAMKSGANIEATKVTREVEPYAIIDEGSGEERMINQYSTVVFGDENVETVFKQNKRVLISEEPVAKAILSTEPVASAAVEA